MSDTVPTDKLKCVVVTPETTVLEAEADFVALPLFDGEVGIAPLRAPMIGRLGFGEMRLLEEGSTSSYYVDGGFVQVADNVVSVLTNRAVPIDELDEGVAGEELQAALQRSAHSPEALAIRDRLQAQGRAKLRLAKKAK